MSSHHRSIARSHISNNGALSKPVGASQPRFEHPHLALQSSSVSSKCIFCSQRIAPGDETSKLVHSERPHCEERSVRVHTACLPACHCSVFFVQHDDDPDSVPQFLRPREHFDL